VSDMAERMLKRSSVKLSSRNKLWFCDRIWTVIMQRMLAAPVDSDREDHDAWISAMEAQCRIEPQNFGEGAYPNIGLLNFADMGRFNRVKIDVP